MYAKLFRQIYDSTLADDWRALVTFQQMLILADRDGMVDMTAAAIARVTNIPADIIQPGLEKLEQPDPHSRSQTLNGQRIALIDSDRGWGWTIVNYGYYRDLANREDKRIKDATRIAGKRESTKSRRVSQKVANVAPTTTTTSTTNTKSIVAQAHDILSFLNEKTGRHYRHVDVNLNLIMARLKEGATSSDVRAIIAMKWRTRKDDSNFDFEKFMRPATLFNRTKFWQYHGELKQMGDETKDTAL